MSLLKHGLTKPELRRAIGRGELVLHYQPEADLRTGEIHDVEALVRWRNLGLRVVAEGVETARAWRGLVQLGCDIAQGYYLSRPVPAEELTEWLRDREAANPRRLRSA